jgi:hypothetical protein
MSDLAYGFSGAYYCGKCGRVMIKTVDGFRDGYVQVQLVCRPCESMVTYRMVPDHVIPEVRDDNS